MSAAQRVPGGRGAWEGQAAGPAGLGDEALLAHEPGGTLVKSLQTIAFDTFEYGFSQMPGDSIYSTQVSLNKPIYIELGQYVVPKGRMLLLTNYKFGVSGLSALEPGGATDLPVDQFQGSLGFDLTINRLRPSILRYELIPVAPPTPVFSGEGGAGLAPSPALIPASPGGLSLLPARDARQGDPQLPFTLYAQEQQSVRVVAVVFRRISTPVTAIKASIQGYLISQQVGVALLQRLRFR
jgi:hypothetical protein